MALRHLIATSVNPAGLIVIFRELERQVEGSFDLFCHCAWFFFCSGHSLRGYLARDGAPYGVFGFLCHFEGNLDFENVLGISTSFAISSRQRSSSRVCVGVVGWLSSATPSRTMYFVHNDILLDWLINWPFECRKQEATPELCH